MGGIEIEHEDTFGSVATLIVIMGLEVRIYTFDIANNQILHFICR